MQRYWEEQNLEQVPTKREPLSEAVKELLEQYEKLDFWEKANAKFLINNVLT